VATLARHADFGKLEPVHEALRRVRRELDPRIALIGFCGAPWTIATHMVAGQGTPDQAPARMMAYRHPEAFAAIIDILVENSIQYLLGQLKAGADVLQIFDTWAGVLPPREFQRWSIEQARRIVAGVRAQLPDAKIIGFPLGVDAQLPAYNRRQCRQHRLGGRTVTDLRARAEPGCRARQSRSTGPDRGRRCARPRGGRCIGKLRRGPVDLRSRPRHSAGNPDRPCRADAEARAGLQRLNQSPSVIPEGGYPVITGLSLNREAAAYWIIRIRA
jgi:hypothetical protein